MKFGQIIIGIVVGAALVWGIGYLSKSSNQGSSKNTNSNQKEEQKAGETAKEQNSTATVSLGDDPLLGDKTKAKIAIVEFSDYECPYCKRFHDQTFDQIVKEYVDSGKAVIVFKDFPLSFHNPAAIDDASAANTVKLLSGDAKYFEYGKLLYANSGLNGKGLAKEKFVELAEKIGIDKDSFSKALESNKGKFKEEIDKDTEEGRAAGITGTPGFVIGKFDADGKVEGELVTGAAPYAQFKEVIEKQLAR